MALKFMYITNDPDVVAIAQQCGVERIWIDLESLGKEERQKNYDSVKSRHCIEDIKRIRPMITQAELLVRINPIHEHSESEIADVVAAGADIIMLPMWKSSIEVREFLHMVKTSKKNCGVKHIKTTLLLETKEAVACIDEVLAMGGFDEIHIGLNDLHLSYNMDFMFQLLADGTVEKLCDKFKAYHLPYGFGGIARLGEGLLPAEYIIKEHYRLGSTRAILSRSFINSILEGIDCVAKQFPLEMEKIRAFEESVMMLSYDDLENNRILVANTVASIVEVKKNEMNLDMVKLQ